MSWTQGQAKQIAKRLVQRVGDGATWLVPEARHALCHQAVLVVVLGQDKDTVSVEAIADLLEMVSREAEKHWGVS
jgi:hypothetical protein